MDRHASKAFVISLAQFLLFSQAAESKATLASKISHHSTIFFFFSVKR